MPDNQIFSQQVFDVFDKKFKKEGVLEMKITEKIVKKDSIIHVIKIVKSNTHTVTPQESGAFDPFAKHKKRIGEPFDISVFKKSNNNFYEEADILGKPTFVSFWFIKCSPCIQEIPLLNEIKNTYNERVNFLAITFDSNEAIQQFLKHKTFDFSHITDARKQLDNLDINAYPMNMLLDENGIIKFVSGNISSKKTIADELNKLL